MGISACPGIANLNWTASVDLVPQNIEGNTTEQVRGGSAEAGIDSDDVRLGWVDRPDGVVAARGQRVQTTVGMTQGSIGDRALRSRGSVICENHCAACGPAP